MARSMWFPLVAVSALFSSSCEVIKDAVDDVDGALATCTDACVQVQECDANPPVPEFGSLGAASSGQGGLDCAAGCASDDRALRGYSDCQLTCITKVECGEIQDCWKPKSDAYAKYCLEGVEVPTIEPAPEDPQPTNDTVSGSEQADDIIEDPAVAIAVDDAEDAGFEVNYGDNPPELVGKYRVNGQIDESRNARPKGSPIQTSICFWDYTQGEGGVRVSYCEDNVPGEDTAPLTGSDDGSFTAYFEYDGQATVLFSGQLNPDGTAASNVEALVVYTYATDVWELSHTDWQLEGQCNSCE